MHRLLATLSFVYAGLSAVHWGAATHWLYGPPGDLCCGNAVSDPYMLLVNILAPLAAAANVSLVHVALKSSRWPPYTVMATLAFVVTSGCLDYEGHLLEFWYGVPLGDVWWLPGV